MQDVDYTALTWLAVVAGLDVVAVLATPRWLRRTADRAKPGLPGSDYRFPSTVYCDDRPTHLSSAGHVLLAGLSPPILRRRASFKAASPCGRAVPL